MKEIIIWKQLKASGQENKHWGRYIIYLVMSELLNQRVNIYNLYINIRVTKLESKHIRYYLFINVRVIKLESKHVLLFMYVRVIKLEDIHAYNRRGDLC